MDNPFKKRRNELITDRRTLLSLISPTPLEEFFRVDGAQLLDKLTMVVGTPGCGKTTIAQVVEFESLATLCSSDAQQINEGLLDVLTINHLIGNGAPTICGHRVSMTTNFRGIWELPYPDATRAALMRAFVQSKAVLGWFRQMEGIGVSIDQIDIVLGDGSDSLAAITKAHSPREFRQYARAVELGIFKVVTALVPPDEHEMAEEFLNTRYDIFEVIRGFRVRQWPENIQAGETLLRPMLVIDDAHELHPLQFVQLRDWLKSKALGVSRWLMCRPDVVAPEDYREAMTREAIADDELTPGSTQGRDYLIKLMQLGSRDAKRFKLTARDIASRYISAIPEFGRRSIRDLTP